MTFGSSWAQGSLSLSSRGASVLGESMLGGGRHRPYSGESPGGRAWGALSPVRASAFLPSMARHSIVSKPLRICDQRVGRRRGPLDGCGWRNLLFFTAPTAYVEIPRPVIEPTLQLQPAPQLRQHQILHWLCHTGTSCLFLNIDVHRSGETSCTLPLSSCLPASNSNK